MIWLLIDLQIDTKLISVIFFQALTGIGNSPIYFFPTPDLNPSIIKSGDRPLGNPWFFWITVWYYFYFVTCSWQSSLFQHGKPCSPGRSKIPSSGDRENRLCR